MYNISIPEDYEGLNTYNSMRSVAGRVQNDQNTAFYMRALYQRVLAGLKLNFPKSWKRAKRYFKNVLFSQGFIAVIKTPDYGVIPQICGFSGYGLYLQPTKILVNQPLVQFEGTIGKDCELIHLCGDYRGVWDIIEHYAIRLSVAITSVDCALMNERLSLLAAGKNKAASDTLKYLFERISAGEPFSVYDKNLKDEGLSESDPIWTFSQDVASQYISDKLLADIDTILQQFDREIGIAAVGEKKERMITDEVNIQIQDSCARSDTWFENMNDSYDNVNELFPELGGISFTMYYGGEAHEYNAEIDADRVL